VQAIVNQSINQSINLVYCTEPCHRPTHTRNLTYDYKGKKKSYMNIYRWFKQYHKE